MISFQIELLCFNCAAPYLFSFVAKVAKLLLIKKMGRISNYQGGDLQNKGYTAGRRLLHRCNVPLHMKRPACGS